MRKSACFMAAVLLALSCALTGCGAALTSAAKLDAYEVGGDSIPSITSVVGERKVEGVDAKTSNGVPSKQYTYASDTMLEDLVAYAAVLRDEEGWLVTEAYDFTVVPGTAQLGKASKDEGKILILSIAYEEGKYAIKITKLEGTIE